MTEQQLETCKKYLRSTLLSNKGGIHADEVDRHYEELVGKGIPYRQLNYRTLDEFLTSIPDVCQIRRSGRDLMVVGVADSATQHIEKMKRKEKNSKTGGKGGRSKLQYVPPRFRGGGGGFGFSSKTPRFGGAGGGCEFNSKPGSVFGRLGSKPEPRAPPAAAVTVKKTHNNNAPRHVNSKNSFRPWLAGKDCGSPVVYCDDQDQGLVSQKPHGAELTKDSTEAGLVNQVDYVSAGDIKGEKLIARDASSSPTMQNSWQRTHDPVLDDIVAKLKSRLQLGNCLKNKAGGMAREKEIPSNNNNQAGLTSKTNSPSLSVVGCVCLRPLKLVFCEVCRETFCGRVRLECRVHPRALYLQDINECKGCKQNNKEALREFDLPQGMEKYVKKVANKKF